MSRYMILFGLAFMLFLLHYTGDIHKYINMRYAYLSIGAIVLLVLLGIVEYIRFAKRNKARQLSGEESHDHHGNDRDHEHEDGHDHGHDHHAHGHSHLSRSRFKRAVGYAIVSVPIFTGIFLPVQTLDSSFVKAKGFSIPSMQEGIDQNPGIHQFLKPDTSVFYSKTGYNKIKAQDAKAFIDRPEIRLGENDFLTGLEVIYNSPDTYMGRTIAFDGFVYRESRVDDQHAFIFRFGFIHCVADSGVFGMLADFSERTPLNNDQWVHVEGKLTWEYYQPIKQTVPVVKIQSWSKIDAPKDPYVYRMF
ncbi:TIGR03943 family putative permease subunit [Paenibacillus cymbidii]|uniref:TIGR03943 family putative permease subunit n=1 Tax=Paenibacillus cymbidii TaxID=1639034 RepID=UPI00143698F5|nr:TIGR03943 family protein [Paenibacillus cymbidii]